jgi:glutathione synthase/RimK-type ligase-like ATP-grasp enzyme
MGSDRQLIADTLIKLFEIEEIEIEDRPKLEQELLEAMDENRIYHFRTGNQWQGFVTWLEKEIEGRKCILINNLLIFREYRNKVNLHKVPGMVKTLYPEHTLIWRNRKRKRIFVTKGTGGKHV